MLDGLLAMRDVITFMYSSMMETVQFRKRTPKDEHWLVAKVIVDELDYPCKIVLKSQDQGHWFMSDALYRVADLYLHLKEKLVEAEYISPESQAASLLAETRARADEDPGMGDDGGARADDDPNMGDDGDTVNP
jgi:hypothetical protein